MLPRLWRRFVHRPLALRAWRFARNYIHQPPTPGPWDGWGLGIARQCDERVGIVLIPPPDYPNMLSLPQARAYAREILTAADKAAERWGGQPAPDSVEVA